MTLILKPSYVACAPPRAARSAPVLLRSRSSGVLACFSRRRAIQAEGISVAAVLGMLGTGAAAYAASVSSPNPQALVKEGMAKFRKNDVEGSVKDFDTAMAASPSMRPYLWQRGLSLYYLEQYGEASKQFRDDVAVNPNDTEESIWAFLSDAQLMGVEAASKQFLEVGRDGRPVMRAAYECFRDGETSPDSISAAISDEGSRFYGLLYIGLWHESRKDSEKARAAMLEAVATKYATLSGDYMADLAKVHCLRRGWSSV